MSMDSRIPAIILFQLALAAWAPGSSMYSPKNREFPAIVRVHGLPEGANLQWGDFHLFVVARTTTPSDPVALLHTGDGPQRISIFSDGNNFKLETSDNRYGKRVGIKTDAKLHLFEVSHYIDKTTERFSNRTAWPGEFRIDGSLCGKFFAERGEMALTGLRIEGNVATRGLSGASVKELVIFGRKLDGKEALDMRNELAGKWKVALTETVEAAEIPGLQETTVGPEGKYSSFGYYNESPESPDGTRIAYIVFDKDPSLEEPQQPFSIWLCDTDLQNHRKVMESPFPVNLHNGAVLQWVDNQHICIGSDSRGGILVVNVRNGQTVYGPYSPGWPGGTNLNGMVLLHMADESKLGQAGLYCLNTRDGKVKRLFATEQFASFYESLDWRGSPYPSDWRFVHGKFSTDGSHIAFTIHTGRGGGQHLFTARSDGTGLRPWGKLVQDRGADKPLHFLWYDDHTLYGVDQSCEDGTPNNLHVKRWDLEGNFIETLAGAACHLGMSPDKSWIAGETFYYDDPVRLYLYNSGHTDPAALVFEHKGTHPTWILGGHVNPSFSRDGRRLYYTRPVDNHRVQAYRCTVPGS